MLDYKRFISYLYTYVEGEKGVNVGYIRCEQRQGICRFTLNLQDRQGIEGGRYKVYLYKADSDGTPVGYYLDEMMISRNCGELRKQTACDNVWNTNNRIEDFDGVIAVYDKEHIYASQWNDEPIQTGLFLTYNDWKERKAGADDSVAAVHLKESEGLALHIAELSGMRKNETEASFSEECSQEMTEELSRNVAEKLWENLAAPEEPATVSTAEASMGEQPISEQPIPEHSVSGQPESAASESTRGEETVSGKEKRKDKRAGISELTLRVMEKSPKLPDFDNHEIYDCVRIEPNDIGLLEMENWRLGVNSFLTHGYYNYKYLMLGKLRFQDGAVKAVLGVPGVFDNKEQYIAKIFGFDIFVPVKHTNVKTGNFGYWIVELV